eukprot:287592_1
MSNQIHNQKILHLSPNLWFHPTTTTMYTSNNETCDLLLLFTMVLFIKYHYYCWFAPFIMCILCARMKFIKINNITCMAISSTTKRFIVNQSHIILLNKHCSNDSGHGYSYFVHSIIILLAFNTIRILHKIGNGNSQHSCRNK